jgi:hypothetical protein
MKDFYCSILLECVPVMLVLWLVVHRDRDFRRNAFQKSVRKGLKFVGASTITLGISDYVGVKYFGLTMFGMTVKPSLYLITAGGGLLAFYWLLCQLLALCPDE